MMKSKDNLTTIQHELIDKIIELLRRADEQELKNIYYLLIGYLSNKK